jgi:hypothetical protein
MNVSTGEGGGEREIGGLREVMYVLSVAEVSVVGQHVEAEGTSSHQPDRLGDTARSCPSSHAQTQTLPGEWFV